MLPLFDLIDDDNDKFWWGLSIRDDKKLVYARLLAYGDESSLIRSLDGALLIDVWNEIAVPADAHPLGRGRRGQVEAPIPAEHELVQRVEDTRRTAFDVVKHANS